MFIDIKMPLEAMFISHQENEVYMKHTWQVLLNTSTQSYDTYGDFTRQSLVALRNPLLFGLKEKEVPLSFDPALESAMFVHMR